MNPEADLLDAFELHDAEGIRAVLDGGFDANASIRGKPAIDWLLEMYSRSDAFPACVRLLLDRGARVGDPRVVPVLLDDVDALAAMIRSDPSVLTHRTTLVSAFTPLEGATLLHVAAEYGHLRAARVLLDAGAEVDARAALDADGLNGHTPLFHTVNSSRNRSAPLMDLLLAAGAQPDVRLAGITWGRGFEWETTCFDVTPVSYAQCGLLPQMHRRDHDVYATIGRLLEASGRPVPAVKNVPNRYLTKGQA